MIYIPVSLQKSNIIRELKCCIKVLGDSSLVIEIFEQKLSGRSEMEKIKTKQSMPTENYRLLLGTALCAFNGNIGFIIENILRVSDNKETNWSALLDASYRALQDKVSKKLDNNSETDISKLFKDICDMRHRIIHSFRITDKDGAQILRTKTKKDDNGHEEQYDITEEYLEDFIELNGTLSSLLHELRGY